MLLLPVNESNQLLVTATVIWNIKKDPLRLYCEELSAEIVDQAHTVVLTEEENVSYRNLFMGSWDLCFVIWHQWDFFKRRITHLWGILYSKCEATILFSVTKNRKEELEDVGDDPLPGCC